MRNAGGIASMLEKLPGVAELPKGALENAGNDKELARTEAIINSMTPQERRRPLIIKGSRKKRIAAGSGTRIQDVNKVLKQVDQMQKMMKRMKKKGRDGRNDERHARNGWTWAGTNAVLTPADVRFGAQRGDVSEIRPL